MVMAVINKQSYYMDGYMKKNLDYVQERVLHHRNMLVCIIDGRVGSGKSTIASQLAYYCSRGKLTLEHETFTPDQFTQALKDANKGDSIVLDEAFEIMNKRTTQSMSNMLILSLLQQMRSKQVFIFIVLPSVFDLDKNIILNLCDMFVHCYRKDFGDRGQYLSYDRNELKKLWLFGRQSYSYSAKIAKSNFRARFTKFFPLDFKSYEEKKMESLKSMVEKNKRTENQKYKLQRNKSIIAMREAGMPVQKISEASGLRSRTIYDILEGKQGLVEAP